MRLRFLLMLMLAFGLMVGPAGLCGYGAGVLQEAPCPCKVPPGETCCVSESDGSAQEIPPGATVSGIDLKSLLAPVRVFLGLQPERVGFAPVDTRDCTRRPATPPLLELNCIRLI